MHGAHIDAELLAQVYINMTRGQDALLMDDASAETGTMSDAQMAEADLSRFTLPVIAASEGELVAHEKVLAELDKASGGKRIWQ